MSSNYFISPFHVSVLFLLFFTYESLIYSDFPGKPCTMLGRNSHSSKIFRNLPWSYLILLQCYMVKGLKPPTYFPYFLCHHQFQFLSPLLSSLYCNLSPRFFFYSLYQQISFHHSYLLPRPYLACYRQYIISFLSYWVP